MSLPTLLSQELQLQRMNVETLDPYGNKRLSSAPAVIVKGYIEQTSSTENLVNRDTAVTRWTCYLPAGTPVGYLDRITFQGQTFQVDGEPHQVFNPRTKSVSHIQAALISVRV